VVELPAIDRKAVDEALAQLLATFGRPHAHAGHSVRVLRIPVYELRATKALRVIFLKQGGVLRVDFVGDHNAVKAYLKNTL